MPQQASTRRDQMLRHAGYWTFFLSGICSISTGVVVSLLRDLHGLSYSTTGTLLSAMNIGNMAAAFIAGVLPGQIGFRKTVLLLASGYVLGYLINATLSPVWALVLAFLFIGLAKGCAVNADTVLVGTHTDDRKTSMQVLHSFYACGALLCPFLINLLVQAGSRVPMYSLAGVGLLMWGVYAFARLDGKAEASAGKVKVEGEDENTFLRDPMFWLLALLLFCQNGAEFSVTGWLVTYYKDTGILSGTLSAYTMTIMWGATLLARLLIAFVIPIRNPFKAMLFMGMGITALYLALVFAATPAMAITALTLFSLSIAGTNPMITASVGNRLSSRSMGIMLPFGSIGGIVMPMLIGAVSQGFGLRAGMLVNLIPCAGLLVLSVIALRRTGKTAAK